MKIEEVKKEEAAKDEVKAEKVKPAKTRKIVDTRKGGLIWTIWHFTEAILLIVLGVLAIVYNNNDNLKSTFIIIIGAFLIADGALRILMNYLPIFNAKEKTALSFNFVTTGALELAAGITLIIERGVANDIATFLIYFISIILIVAGVSFLMFAAAFIQSKLYKVYMPVLEIILGLALIAAGVVILCFFKPGDEASGAFYSVVLIMLGVLSALAGVGMIVSTSLVVVAENRKRRILKRAGAMQEAIHNGIEEAKKDDDDKPTIIDVKNEDK